MPSFLGDPFRHDLFVSYSHGAFDASGESKLKKWSQAFVRELEGELKSDPKYGDLKVFLDQDHRPDQGLDPMDPLSDQLCGEIELAGILTVLMSPHYLLSKWCGDELAWWVQSQEKHKLTVEGRVAVVRVWPTEDQWPGALTDSRGERHIGFKFHDEDRPQPFEWPDPSDAKGPFRDAMLEMVGRLWQNLRTLKEQLEEQRKREEGATRLAAQHGQVIYLHGREEHAAIWQRANGILAAEGFVVTPGEPDPVTREAKAAREIASRRVETLSACDGLLLLGTDDGRALDADLVVVGRQDRHSARDRSDRLLPCAVLNTNGQDTATPTRRKMAQALGIDWIDTSSGLWTTDVKSWLIEASKDAELVR